MARAFVIFQELGSPKAGQVLDMLRKQAHELGARFRPLLQREFDPKLAQLLLDVVGAEASRSKP